MPDIVNNPVLMWNIILIKIPGNLGIVQETVESEGNRIRGKGPMTASY